MLPALIIETGEHPTASVIWLHGLGADGHDFEPVVPELGLPPELPVRFIFPHAPVMPVTLNGGYIMPAWYDIRESDLGIEHDGEGIKRSAKAIGMLIEKELMQGCPADRIMLAGFSQGAAMALHVGLRQQQRLAGIIALSGYLLQPETLPDSITDAGRTTPIFMAHGVLDPIVPYALGDHGCRKLKALGCTVDWHSYPMEHHVCAEEIRLLGGWIRERLGLEPG
ncbi:MAG TPA: dienelactone hydrolase family protein [Mariprofundaceae bacterium]|nr:dienelactone hydrolase family protein [Mariprofundaceae bacterium]